MAQPEQMIGACFGKIVKIAFRLDNHQVHIERLCCRSTRRFDDRGAEGDVRYEPSVHDVDMTPISTGLIDGADFFANPPQIGSKSAARIEGATIIGFTIVSLWLSPCGIRCIAQSHSRSLHCRKIP